MNGSGLEGKKRESDVKSEAKRIGEAALEGMAAAGAGCLCCAIRLHIVTVVLFLLVLLLSCPHCYLSIPLYICLHCFYHTFWN